LAATLALYASICQAAGLVPIVEPEVLSDGAHSADDCSSATERALTALFARLALARVDLGGLLLKPNMVTAGRGSGVREAPAEVAERTLAVLRRSVPPACAGIAFLSGGQTEAEACANLDAIVQLARQQGGAPWPLSFSFGRALQTSTLAAWGGKAANVAAAQGRFAARMQLTGAAARGEYSPDADKET
jgi:fructose-bisphosphate aldolase class I